MSVRWRLAVLTTGLGLWGAGLWLAGAPEQAHAGAAEPLVAGDAKTWHAVLTDKDLNPLVEQQLANIKDAMKTNGTFLRGFRKVQLAGHLIAGLGNIGTLRLEGDEAKKAAALREAGLELAKSAKEKKFENAKKAFALLEGYPAEIAPAGNAAPAKWEVVLPLDILMKGVSAIDSATGTAVRKDAGAFAKSAKEMSNDSTLLACLAVVAREHNANMDWKGWCDEMREGSLAMAREFAKKDPAATKQARENLQKSCNACHEVYRKEE